MVRGGGKRGIGHVRSRGPGWPGGVGKWAAALAAHVWAQGPGWPGAPGPEWPGWARAPRPGGLGPSPGLAMARPPPPASTRHPPSRGNAREAAAGPSPPGSEATAVAAAGPSPPGSEATAEANAEAWTALPPSPPHPSPGDPLGRGQGPGRDDSSPLLKECTPQGASVMYRGSWVHYSWWSLTRAHGFAWTPPLTKYIPVLAPTLKNYILPWVAAAHSGGGERMGEGGAQNLRKYISHPSLTRYIFVAGRRPLSCFLFSGGGERRTEGAMY